MPFTLPFQEPITSDYIYIDDQNQVHLLVPLSGGGTIGTDNTCQLANEIKAFFNGAARRSLQQHLSAIEQDLKLLPASSTIYKEKQQRAQQLEVYLNVLTALDYEHDRFFSQINGSYTGHPRFIQRMMARADNFGAMHLSPNHIDTYLGINYANFSLHRSFLPSLGNSLRSVLTSELGYYLERVQPYEESPRSILINAVLAKVGKGKGADIALLKQTIRQTMQELYGEKLLKEYGTMALDLDTTQDKQFLDVDYLEMILGFDYPNEDNADLIGGILSSAIADDNYWQVLKEEESVLNKKHETAEKLSLAVQMFLAHTNFYCCAHGLSGRDFSGLLDSFWFRNTVAYAVADAQCNGRSTEQALFDVINNSCSWFGLSTSLSLHHQQAILKGFNANYITTQGSPHYDEFVEAILEAPGLAVGHKGKMSFHFAECFKYIFNDVYSVFNSNELNQALLAARAQLPAIAEAFKERPSNDLPGNNENTQYTFYDILADINDSTLERLEPIITDGYQSLSHVQKALLFNGENGVWQSLMGIEGSYSLSALELEKFMRSGELAQLLKHPNNYARFVQLLTQPDGQGVLIDQLSPHALYQLTTHPSWHNGVASELVKQGYSEEHCSELEMQAESEMDAKYIAHFPEIADLDLKELSKQLEQVLVDYENRPWYRKITAWLSWGSNRQQQLAKISQLQQYVAAHEHAPLPEKQATLKEVHRVLVTISRDIVWADNSKWFFSFQSSLLSLVSPLLDSLNNRFPSLIYASNEGLGKAVNKILIKEFKIEEDSPLLELKQDWWQQDKIDFIKSLPAHFHSMDAVLYFNRYPSEAFDEAAQAGLKLIGERLDFNAPKSPAGIRKLAGCFKFEDAHPEFASLFEHLEALSIDADEAHLPFDEINYYLAEHEPKVKEQEHQAMLVGLTVYLKSIKTPILASTITEPSYLIELAKSYQRRQLDELNERLERADYENQLMMWEEGLIEDTLASQWWTGSGLTMFSELVSIIKNDKREVKQAFIVSLNKLYPAKLNAQAQLGLRLAAADDTFDWQAADEPCLMTKAKAYLQTVAPNVLAAAEGDAFLAHIAPYYLNVDNIKLLNFLEPQYFTKENALKLNQLQTKALSLELVVGLNLESDSSKPLDNKPSSDALEEAGKRFLDKHRFYKRSGFSSYIWSNSWQSELNTEEKLHAVKALRTIEQLKTEVTIMADKKLLPSGYGYETRLSPASNRLFAEKAHRFGSLLDSAMTVIASFEPSQHRPKFKSTLDELLSNLKSRLLSTDHRYYLSSEERDFTNKLTDWQQQLSLLGVVEPLTDSEVDSSPASSSASWEAESDDSQPPSPRVSP